MAIPRPHATTVLPEIWELAWLGEADLSPDSLSAARPQADAAFEERMSVPGCFDTLPQHAGARGTVAVRTYFTSGDEPAGILQFDGVGIWAAVYGDGELLHVQRKPYSPFTVAVPAASGERELVVLLDNRFDTGRSPLQENYFDFYAYGGIFRPVRYVARPAVHIERVAVTTVTLDPPTIEVTVHANRESAVDLSFHIDGTALAFAQPEGPTKVSTPRQLAVANASPWSPETPELHSLSVTLTAGGSTDCYQVPFGLRTVEVTDGRILLNGEPIRLFGWNRHEVHPQFGPALPVSQMVQDLEMMRAAGANFVRGSHYPQDDRFLDLCDQLGVLVWEESLGWQQTERHFADQTYQTLIGEQQLEMIQAHGNHPSIIMWGFQNELASDASTARAVIENLASISRTADPSRPVTFASCRFPNDVCLDLVDIISLNVYPGWYAADQEEYRPLEEIGERLNAIRDGLAEMGLADRPLIISEIGAGAIYGWRDAHGGHWSEQYQTDYLSEVCTQFLARPEISGLALWQFCDGRTYGSSRALGRPRTFNNKGIVDEYRRPKDAYGAVQALMEEQI
jgi:beta-glucuronidase